MNDYEQFLLVIQRMKLIAQLEYYNDIESNLLVIFNKLSRIEKIILLRYVITNETNVECSIPVAQLVNVDTIIGDTLDKERESIYGGSKKEIIDMKLFIAKTLVVGSMFIVVMIVLIGGGGFTEIIKDAIELINIVAGVKIDT